MDPIDRLTRLRQAAELINSVAGELDDRKVECAACHGNRFTNWAEAKMRLRLQTTARRVMETHAELSHAIDYTHDRAGTR